MFLQQYYNPYTLKKAEGVSYKGHDESCRENSVYILPEVEADMPGGSMPHAQPATSIGKRQMDKTSPL